MFIRNGKLFTLPAAGYGLGEDGTIYPGGCPDGVDGINYPSGTGPLFSPDGRLALGIEDRPDPVRPDERLFNITQNEDGSYNAEPKENALAEFKVATERQIDADADAIYVAVMGTRAAEYAQSEIEAQAYKDAGYTGTVPPCVEPWAAATGNTAKWAADDILAIAAAWRQAQVVIRQARLVKKAAVRNAPDFAALAVVKGEWQGFVSFMRDQLGI